VGSLCRIIALWLFGSASAFCHVITSRRMFSMQDRQSVA
jgi:hypothetical protein